ncbi:hypothetical protein MD484_g1013, partial [Candolleomyces efflorescens]
MFTRALAVASFALFAQVASAATCTRTYTIKEGDYCDKISAANNVSTYQLGAINPGVINEACDNLVIGGELCLGTQGEDCTATYVVSAGNVCSQIWDNHRINSTIFSLNNPQVNEDCTNIYTGQVLCVSPEVLVPAAPGVPIHTGAPAVASSTPVAKPPATSAPAVAATPAPASTTPPPVAAAAPTKSADADEDEEEDCDEWEVVEGPTDEDIPFCDEVL